MNRLDFVVGMIREQDWRMEQLAGQGAKTELKDELVVASEQGQQDSEGALAEARKRARRRF